MAGSFAYQKQLVDGEFQPLGVYTNTVDANYTAPADASLIRWNVPAQLAGRSIDFSLVPAGSEVQVEVIDSNGQNVEEAGLIFILNDTAPRVVNIRSVDGAGTVVLSDGTTAEYDIGTSGTTVALNDGNITRSGTLTQSALARFLGAVSGAAAGLNRVDVGLSGTFPSVIFEEGATVWAIQALGGLFRFEASGSGNVFSLDVSGGGLTTALTANLNNGAKIGSAGGSINAILVGTATWDPGSTATGTVVSTTLTVTGAAVGDVAIPSWEDTTAGWVVTAFVSAANTVTVNALFMGAVSSDPGSFTLRAWVIKR